MYSVFQKLCAEKGVSPSAVAIACGFAPSVISRWKRGESTPKADKMKLIAKYFDVSLQYLMTGMELTPEQALMYGINADPIEANISWYYENDDLKMLIDTVKDAPSDVLVRLRYYAEGLLAARKEMQ